MADSTIATLWAHKARWILVVVALTIFVGSANLPTSNSAYSSLGTNETNSSVAQSKFDFETAVIDDAPWSWWRLNDTSGSSTSSVLDHSGNGRTGTVSSIGVVRGTSGAIVDQLDSSYNFDGSSGCVVHDTSTPNPTTFSLELWFKGSSFSNTNNIAGGPLISMSDNASAGSGGTRGDRAVFMTTAGTLSFNTYNGSSYTTVTSPSVYNDSAWHHVVATLGSDGQKLYVDGVLVASHANTTAYGSYANGYWHVGCGATSGWANTKSHFPGDIDEVAIYTTQLSQTQVSNHFRSNWSQTPYERLFKGDALNSYWRLGELSGTSMIDSRGSNTGTYGGTVTLMRDGVVPGNLATSFNGSTGCAVGNSPVSNPTEFTQELWFITASTSGGVMIGFSDGSGANTTATNFDRNLYMTDSGAIRFAIDSGTVQSIASTDTYNDGMWHHAAATLDPSGMKLYVDGELVASSASAVAKNFTGYWHIGCNKSSGSFPNNPTSSYFNATLDEAAIWTKALDSSEIESHYLAGISSKGLWRAMRQYTPTMWTRLQTLTNWTDGSGNGNTFGSVVVGDGDLSQGVTPGNNALYFDGSLTCGAEDAANISNPATMTWELWFQTQTTTGGGLVGYSSSDVSNIAAAPVNNDRMIYMDDLGRINFGVDGTNKYVITSPGSYNDGVWHHVVATLSAANSQRLYVDGVMVASGGGSAGTNFAGKPRIGCVYLNGWSNAPTSGYFKGVIDEVAIDNAYEMSPATVRAHYMSTLISTSPAAIRESKPLSYWRLGETSGTTASDFSSNDRTASVSASGVTWSHLGITTGDGSAVFDGNSGCMVGDDRFENPRHFTLELWFKTTTDAGGELIGFSNGATPSATGTLNDRHLYMSDSGQIVFGVNNSSESKITTALSYNDGVWHHVSAVFGDRGRHIYVDGVLVASGASAAADSYDGYWHVGCNSFSGWSAAPTSEYFDGAIDEVVIYSQTIDSSTIRYRHGLVHRTAATYYSSVMRREPDLYWRLNEASGNALDSSSNSIVGTASGSGLTRSIPGVPYGDGDTSVTFDGSTGCYVSSSSYSNPTVFTIEVFFKTSSTSGGVIVGFSDSSSATNAGTNFDRVLYLRDSGEIQFAVNDGGFESISTTKTYNDDRFHHVVATLSNDGQKIYVDGQLEASGNETGAQNYVGYWHLGCNKTSASLPNSPTNAYLNGTLDELVIYDFELPPDTIYWHFQNSQR